MQQIKVYISAKLEHAPKLAALKQDGFHINARWIDLAKVGRERMKPVTHWQQENFDDIAMAHFVIMYLEPGDKLKGSLFEIGYAIGIGKKVWIAGDGHGVEMALPVQDGEDVTIRLPHRDIEPWARYRQSIRVVPSLDEAFTSIRRLVRPDVLCDLKGNPIPPEQF